MNVVKTKHKNWTTLLRVSRAFDSKELGTFVYEFVIFSKPHFHSGELSIYITEGYTDVLVVLQFSRNVNNIHYLTLARGIYYDSHTLISQTINIGYFLQLVDSYVGNKI